LNRLIITYMYKQNNYTTNIKTSDWLTTIIIKYQIQHQTNYNLSNNLRSVYMYIMQQNAHVLYTVL